MLAAIVVVPDATLVASPCDPLELLMVAALVLLDVHVTDVVMLLMVPSHYVPVAVNCCAPPTTTDDWAGVTAMPDSTALPVPPSNTTCGLPPPSSVKVMTADREPTAWGVKVIVKAQFAPGPSVDPQVLF